MIRKFDVRQVSFTLHRVEDFIIIKEVALLRDVKT